MKRIVPSAPPLLLLSIVACEAPGARLPSEAAPRAPAAPAPLASGERDAAADAPGEAATALAGREDADAGDGGTSSEGGGATADSTPPPGMLLVPGGTFTMGADEGGEQDERPAHAVTLPAFFLDVTEVTNEAYDACVAKKACRAGAQHAGGPRHPVRFVSWEDARTFCASLGRRLPREAEFERAVRGDDGRRFPWGNDAPTPDRAVYGGGMPLDVGSKPAGRGPYGHLDLTGSVWEWMDDEYDPFAYRRPTAAQGKPGSCPEILEAQNQLRKEGKQGFTGTNAIPNECEHAIRGGAYNYGGPGLRSTNRVHHPGTWRIAVLGFRCAKDAR